MVNLLDIYTALARERPDEPAVIFEREPYIGIRLSWAQLAARGEELSLRLATAGLRIGEDVSPYAAPARSRDFVAFRRLT
jgi:non-ribosomal peptide synthetase component E (peptide arylation enzyme)